MKRKTEIEKLAGTLEQIQNQLMTTNESITITEYEVNNYEKEAEYNNNYIKVNDDNHKKDMTILQKRICEQENILLKQEQCKRDISEVKYIIICMDQSVWIQECSRNKRCPLWYSGVDKRAGDVKRH